MRLLSASIFIAALAACSYGHGIDRLLSFDKEIKDFSCFTEALNTLGYNASPTPHGVNYQGQETPYLASFWYARISEQDSVIYQKDQIVHTAGFGSGPAACDTVKLASKEFTDTERKVLLACNLEPLDIKEDVRCAK